jgi:hypothetical protein
MNWSIDANGELSNSIPDSYSWNKSLELVGGFIV